MATRAIHLKNRMALDGVSIQNQDILDVRVARAELVNSQEDKQHNHRDRDYPQCDSRN